MTPEGPQLAPGAAMSVRTRPATEDDVADLTRMHLAAMAETLDSKGGPNLVATVGRGPQDRARSSFREELREPTSEVIVASLAPGEETTGESSRSAEVVLGYGVLRYPGPEAVGDEAPVAVIRELWVDPRARRIGMGTALLERACDAALEHGCGVDSLPYRGPRRKNFFENHSMVARAIVVHCGLLPADDRSGD
ncbi:MAG: GNAT family N-acetyltransferase [Microthrixaceae bacterium]